MVCHITLLTFRKQLCEWASNKRIFELKLRMVMWGSSGLNDHLKLEARVNWIRKQMEAVALFERSVRKWMMSWIGPLGEPGGVGWLIVYLVRSEGRTGAGKGDVHEVLLITQPPERRHHRWVEVVPPQRVLLFAAGRGAAWANKQKLFNAPYLNVGDPGRRKTRQNNG